jgi:sporulation protein YlmC with PRC-barrel domain
MIAALMHGHELIGRPVVDGSTGDDVAEIKDVVFDPGRGEITGFTLRKRGFLGRRLKAVLPADQVVSVGTDAVMIDGIEALTSPGDVPDEMAPAPNGNCAVEPGGHRVRAIARGGEGRHRARRTHATGGRFRGERRIGR